MTIEPYVTDAPQDPHEPVWETDANIESMTAAVEYAGPSFNDFDDDNDTPLRTADGVLGFVRELAEEVFDSNVAGSQLPDIQSRRQQVDTREVGSDKFRARRHAVLLQSSSPILVNSPCRRTVTLINYGPGTVSISSVPSGNGYPNTVEIPVSSAAFWAPIFLETRDDIWAYTASATIPAMLHTIEEFDLS